LNSLLRLELLLRGVTDFRLLKEAKGDPEEYLGAPPSDSCFWAPWLEAPFFFLKRENPSPLFFCFCVLSLFSESVMSCARPSLLR
jgi:hypothetical protein